MTLNGAGDFSGTASALVLNSQNNSGSVTAGASSNLTVALNGLAQPAATNSTVSLAGNSVNALAVGNSSVNTLNMAGLNNGASAAVGNHQVNSGPITATASAMLTIGASGGPVTGSTLGVSGNAIGATAVGNSATITITNN